MMKKRKINAVFPLPAPALALVVGIIASIAYGLFVASPLIAGPLLTLDEPYQTSSGTHIISGTTKRVSKLAINELEVPLSDEGAFSVERAYPAGYTVVRVVASDRFGRSRERIFTFVTTSNNDSEKNNPNEKEHGDTQGT